MPATPAMPRISPARSVKLDGFEPLDPVAVGQAQVADFENHVARRRGLLVHPQKHAAPDHQLGELGGAGLGGRQRADHLAAPHDADLVGDRHDLAKLVGDEDDRLALVAQAAQDAEQMVRLGGRQNAGRLVEDQDVGLAVERLEDLDALLEAHGEVAHHRVRIDLELVILRKPRQFGARLGQRRPEQGAVLRAQDDVLENGEGLHQHEVLMHHADSGGDGRLAVGDLDGPAIDADLAGIGVVEPVEDGHQRGFSRAVLADDAVDRSAADRQMDVLVGLNRAEALGDADEFDGEGRIRRPPLVRSCGGARHRHITGQLSSSS